MSDLDALRLFLAALAGLAGLALYAGWWVIGIWEPGRR